jgi:hypothetical protein
MGADPMAVVSTGEEDLSAAMVAVQEATGIKQRTEEGSEPHVSRWRVGLFV